MKFTVAAVQMAPTKADYAANVQKAGDTIVQASGEGADLVVFPETALTGYFLEGGVGDVAVTAEQVGADLLGATKGKLARDVDVIIGYYERDSGNIYNTASRIAISGGTARVLHSHRKFFLPTYGVFDEERFVARGRDIATYDTRFGKFAILICEDIWHSVTPTVAALKGALVIAAIAASPARGFDSQVIGNLAKYHRLVQAISDEHGVWTINAMLVGFEGGKGFTGGSVICDPFGKTVAEGPMGEEYVLMSEIDMDMVNIARDKSPLLADLMSVLEDVTREFDDVNEDLQR